MKSSTPKEALALAVEAAGGAVAVGKAFGISSQAVSQWAVAPAARVKGLVDLCGGRVTEYDLRPDIFGPPMSDESLFGPIVGRLCGVLREDERIALALALSQGPEAAQRAVDGLDLAVAVREELLAAAQAAEGRAA